MSYNPYAAPSAEPRGPEGPRYGGGAPQPWEIGEVLSEAWDRFKMNWALLVFTQLAVQAIANVPQQLPTILKAAGVVDEKRDPVGYFLVFLPCLLVSFAISSYLQCGLTRIWIGVARGETPGFGEIFSGGSRFLPMLGLQLLYALVITLGMLLLIVPGVILAIGLMLSQMFLIDQEMGPVEAMRASWEATQGHKGKLFLFLLVSILVMIAGVVACCFGILAAVPTVWVATAIIYLRITGRGPQIAPPAPWGAPPPPPQDPYGGYPPGYGPPKYP